MNFLKSNFVRGKFFSNSIIINLPWGHMRSHKKIGPDWFSRFRRLLDTNRQTDKQSIYAEVEINGIIDFLI